MKKMMRSVQSRDFQMMSKGVLTLALIACSLLTFGQSPETKKALRFIDIEQPSKGIEALEKLAASGKSSDQYYLGLGYLRTGQKDKAAAAFDKGISINEKDGLNHAGKGHIKVLEKNPTEAKLHLDKALTVSKQKDVGVLKAVGEAYLADSKYLLDALNVLNKAKTINQTDADVNLLLGDAYLMQNNGGEAVSSYERAGRSDAKYGKPHHRVALVYKRSRNKELMIEHLNQAVAADPEYAPAYKDLGETYYLKNEAPKAVEAQEKYFNITENKEAARYQLAFYYLLAKQFDKANTIFKEVINSSNASPVALKYYAYSLFEQGKFNEARGVFEQYFSKMKPEELQAGDFAYYGQTLEKLGLDSLANENFARSLDLDSAQTNIADLHAKTLMKRKKYAEAADAYAQLASLRQAPVSSDFWNIGQAHFFAENYPLADSAFNQVIALQTDKTKIPAAVYLFSARAKANIDSTMSQGIAKPMYDAYLEKALLDPEKNKKGILETYEYLGAYYIFKEKNVEQAKTFYQKILAIEPKHAQANEFMKTIKG